MKRNKNDEPLDSYLRSLSQSDQAQAAIDTFADMISAFYLRLRANGVPPAATLELTKLYQAGLILSTKDGD